MTSNTGSVQSFRNSTPTEMENALGLPQFPNASSWYLVQNGMIFQGGLTAELAIGTTDITLPCPLEKQRITAVITVVDALTATARVINTGNLLTTLRVNVATAATKIYWYVVGV